MLQTRSPDTPYRAPARGAILAALLGLMLVTRSPQLGGIDLLHAGSWALFFAAGFYLRGVASLTLLLAAAFAADAIALGWGQIASVCFTPAYALLLPAYASLWAAGRWYSDRHRLAWDSLRPLAAALFLGALVCEAFSSGGYYWLSGAFASPGMIEFLARESLYFPAYFATLCLWTGVIAALHVGLRAALTAAPHRGRA
jgi:hypothetical protein